MVIFNSYVKLPKVNRWTRLPPFLRPTRGRVPPHFCAGARGTTSLHHAWDVPLVPALAEEGAVPDFGQESHGANGYDGYNGYNQIILNWTILGNWKPYFWDPPFYKHCIYESHPETFFHGQIFSVFTRGQRISIRCCIPKNIISHVSNDTCFDIYNLLLISNGHLQHLVVVVDRGWAPRST